MLFDNSAFIGVQPSTRPALFTCAVLDPELNVVALASGDARAVVAHATAQPATTLALNAPARTSRPGTKKSPLQPGLTPEAGAALGMRAAEYELRQRGIPLRPTEPNEAALPMWVRSALALRRNLTRLGFVAYPGEGAAHRLLEAHPLVTFTALVGAAPLARQSMEGRLQRALVLYEHGLQIHDPMLFFEEITRHKLLIGQWPAVLPSPDELDALSAAYTAYVAAIHPGQLTLVGNRLDGQIAAPVAELLPKY
jgi:hypothetical protein